MNWPQSDVDVLIIGAGPAGLRISTFNTMYMNPPNELIQTHAGQLVQP
jgi:thioredoxin reductase